MLPVQLHNIVRILNEERRNDIVKHNIERRIMRDNSDPFALSDTKFIETFRLTKDMVNYLHRELNPHMTQSLHPNTVRPILRILAALNFYATGSYQRSIGNSYMLSMSQRSVSNYVEEISNLIINYLAETWIKFPTTRIAKQQLKHRFMELTAFPGTIGAIDCTHVAILTPVEEEHNYLNRKGYHSKNVQIVCDADLRILNINARYAGATHDAYIWRNSIIREALEQCYNAGDTNSWLLGDSGYPQEPWLMTPILNAPIGSHEERYTNRHASARNCVERCNGVLKCRFRCIMGERMLRYSPEKAGNIINACAILHNICTDARLAVDMHAEQNENNGCDELPALNSNNNNPGREARRALIERYF